MPYFSGQGRIYLAERDVNGDAEAFDHIGNAPVFNLELATDTVEHRESRSGQRVTDLILTTAKSVTVNLTLEEFTLENLAKALYGSITEVAGGTVTVETFPTVESGQYVKLDHGKVTLLVLTDSTGSPVTLDGDNYELMSAATGMIRIKDLTGLTQPIKAAYTYAASKKVNMFTQPRKDYWLRFDGVNTADQDKACTVDIYKVSLNPAASLPLINDELAQLELTGGALYDDLKPNSGALGKFGVIDMAT